MRSRWLGRRGAARLNADVSAAEYPRYPASQAKARCGIRSSIGRAEGRKQERSFLGWAEGRPASAIGNFGLEAANASSSSQGFVLGQLAGCRQQGRDQPIAYGPSVSTMGVAEVLDGLGQAPSPSLTSASRSTAAGSSESAARCCRTCSCTARFVEDFAILRADGDERLSLPDEVARHDPAGGTRDAAKGRVLQIELGDGGRRQRQQVFFAGEHADARGAGVLGQQDRFRLAAGLQVHEGDRAARHEQSVLLAGAGQVEIVGAGERPQQPAIAQGQAVQFARLRRGDQHAIAGDQRVAVDPAQMLLQAGNDPRSESSRLGARGY